MGDRDVERRTTIGLALAGAAGVIALSALYLWPRRSNLTLLALSMAWLCIQMLVMAPRIPRVWSSSLRELYPMFRGKGYRTSPSAKILGLIAMTLLFYSIISSW